MSDDDQKKFADLFVYDWTPAVTRVDKGRNLMRGLKKFIEERAALEQLYSQRLQAIANGLEVPSTESNGMTEVITAVKAECGKRANYAQDLAAALRDDLLYGAVISTIANHKQVLGHILRDAESQKANLEAAKAALEEAQRDMAISGKQCYQHATEALNSELWSCGTHSRMALRWIGKIKEYDVYERRYTSSRAAYNETVNLYKERIKTMLHSLQDMDRKRLCCIKDTLLRLAVFDLGYIRNCQYDVEQTSKILKHLNPEEELNNFIKSNESTDLSNLSTAPKIHWSEVFLNPTGEDGVRESLTTPVEAARSFLHKSAISSVVQSAVAHLGISTQSQHAEPILSDLPITRCPINTSPQDVLKWLAKSSTTDHGSSKARDQALAEYQKRYEDALDLIWNFVPEDMSKTVFDIVQEVIEDMKTFLHRTVFLHVLAGKCEQGLYELPNIDALHILGQIMEACLRNANEQFDIPTIRQSIVLVQKFYAHGGLYDDPHNTKTNDDWMWPHMRSSSRTTEIATPRAAAVSTDNTLSSESITETVNAPTPTVPWFLHRAVYSLNLWSHVRIWEETLLYSIAQEQQVKLVSETEKVIFKRFGLSSSSEENHQFPRICVSLIPSFVECMLAFGIPLEDAEGLIRGVLTRHGLLEAYESKCLQSLPKPEDPVCLPFSPLPNTLAYPKPMIPSARETTAATE